MLRSKGHSSPRRGNSDRQMCRADSLEGVSTRAGSTGSSLLYRSTVFWTHSATKSCCRSQQTALLMSDLGGRFVSMPSNQPGLIVSTLKLTERQAEVFDGVKGLEP